MLHDLIIEDMRKLLARRRSAAHLAAAHLRHIGGHCRSSTESIIESREERRGDVERLEDGLTISDCVHIAQEDL